MANTIGDKKSILTGRRIEVLKCSFGVRPVSRADLKFKFPVSFCMRLVLCFRTTYAYVSRLKTKLMIHATPACAYISLECLVECVSTYKDRNKPEWPAPSFRFCKISTSCDLSALCISMTHEHIPTGPTAGPKSGPIIMLAIALPLFSIGYKSATVPDARVIGQLAATPARNRNTVSAPILLATAHAMLKMRNMTLQMLYIGARP